MTRIQRISLQDGIDVFVEVLSAKADNLLQDDDLPEGAVPTGAVSEMVDAALALEQTIRGILGTVRKACAESGAKECGIELNIGFAGKTTIVPVILSGEATASLKIHARWSPVSERAS